MITARRGTVVIYRLFDVADSISLEQASHLVQRGQTRRLDLKRLAKRQVHMPAPPLSFELGQQRLALDGQDYVIDTLARIFDFGVISVILRVSIAPGTALESLIGINARLSEHPAVELLAKDLLLQVFDELKAAMQKPYISGFVEDYTITYVEEFAEPVDIEVLGQSPVLARLLLAEDSPRGVSAEAMSDALISRFSYFPDELAIIDWNSAFIYDTQGASDISDLIEFASAQLLELRFYDDLLDREITKMYESIERLRGAWRKNQYQGLARRLMQVVLEVTDLTEKIDNSLKWVGDIYLARVYAAASEEFNLSRWQQQVERKLSLVNRVTELLTNQINADRTLLLETSVVFLIVLEVILAFVGR